MALSAAGVFHCAFQRQRHRRGRACAHRGSVPAAEARWGRRGTALGARERAFATASMRSPSATGPPPSPPLHRRSNSSSLRNRFDESARAASVFHRSIGMLRAGGTVQIEEILHSSP